jgi:hypothetical protein
MSRKGLTQVQFEKFVKTAQQAGLTLVSKGGWTKAFPPGQTRGKSLGIPNTKLVTRVELVGFENELAVAHPKSPAATVTQVINFVQDEKLILRDFYKVAKFLATLVVTESVTPAVLPAIPADAVAEFAAEAAAS